MPSPQHRCIDYLFFSYYLIQIPTTLLFDTQGVYTDWLYPAWLRSIRDHYLESYRDPFLANAWKHPWYLSICLTEHFVEVPFFFWATKSYFYGAKVRPQVLIPSIIYCAHTITVVLGIWAMAMCADFSQETALAPRNLLERLKLCSAYAPFFFIPLTNLVDSAKLAWKWKLD